MKTEGLPNNPSPTSVSHSPPPLNLSPEIKRILPEINNLSQKTIERPVPGKAPPLLGRVTATANQPPTKDQFIKNCTQAVLNWNEKHPTGPKINPYQEK